MSFEKGHEPSWKSFSYGSSQLGSDSSLLATLGKSRSIITLFLFFPLVTLLLSSDLRALIVDSRPWWRAPKTKPWFHTGTHLFHHTASCKQRFHEFFENVRKFVNDLHLYHNLYRNIYRDAVLIIAVPGIVRFPNCTKSSKNNVNFQTNRCFFNFLSCSISMSYWTSVLSLVSLNSVQNKKNLEKLQ